ncbi:MAG: NUDIX hydrolase [Oscillospiraceae bacterium]
MTYPIQISSFAPCCEQERSDQRILLRLVKQYGDGLLTRENPCFHLVSSAFLVNAARDRMLLVRHNLYNAWGWTGGHADGQADLLAVALREAEEETGVRALCPLSEQAVSLDILPAPGHFKNGRYVSAHLHLGLAFAIEADEHEPHDASRTKTAARSGFPSLRWRRLWTRPQCCRFTGRFCAGSSCFSGKTGFAAENFA